jgi:hypothetical protein
MRFLSFLLGIAEINAFNCYQKFHDDGKNIVHGVFKDNLTISFLKYCQNLIVEEQDDSTRRMELRSAVRGHRYVSTRDRKSDKRRRLVDRPCNQSGISGT